MGKIQAEQEAAQNQYVFKITKGRRLSVAFQQPTIEGSQITALLGRWAVCRTFGTTVPSGSIVLYLLGQSTEKEQCDGTEWIAGSKGDGWGSQACGQCGRRVG